MLNHFKPAETGIALDPQHAVSEAAAGRITLIDIREPGEVQATGKAIGALHVPLAALRMKADPASPEQLPEFRSGKPVALYCASGGRSQMAARMLRQMGLDQVYNLGGLVHWQMAGGAVGH